MFPSSSCFVVGLLFFAASHAFAVVIPFSGPDEVGRRQVKLANVVTSCKLNGTVALTFDDGPFIYTDQITDALDAANAKGTFFVNGANWACVYDNDMTDRVKYAYDHGHQVASHTWNHLHLNTLDEHSLHVQFWLSEEAIYRITGAYPAFTRPPFGEYNDLVRQVAAARNMTLANWDFDSGDSSGATGPQCLGNYQNLVAVLHPLSILTLNHEVAPGTVQVLPDIIKTLQGAGYKLTTLAECLDMDPYQWVSVPQARDAGWTCQGRV